jgi:hypothetical protein
LTKCAVVELKIKCALPVVPSGRKFGRKTQKGPKKNQSGRKIFARFMKRSRRGAKLLSFVLLKNIFHVKKSILHRESLKKNTEILASVLCYVMRELFFLASQRPNFLVDVRNLSRFLMLATLFTCNINYSYQRRRDICGCTTSI